MSAPIYVMPTPMLSPCIADSLTPRLKNIAYGLHDATKESLELIVPSMLSSISTLVAPIADVINPLTNRAHPTAIYVFIIAASGEGKSAVDKVVFKAIFDFDKSRDIELPKAIIAYKAELTVWLARAAGLRAKVRAATKKGEPSAEFEGELRRHVGNPPKEPDESRLIWTSATHSGLISTSAKQRALTFAPRDGSWFFDSGLWDIIDDLNSAHSGEQIAPIRSRGESAITSDPCLTLYLNSQPGILDSFTKKYGARLRNTGFLARVLCIQPQPQGFRAFSEIRPDHPAVAEWSSLMTDLLGLRNRERNERIGMRFDGEYAEIRWRNYSNDIEHFKQSGQYLSDMTDFGAKFMDNMSRLAALMHFAEKQEDVIPTEPLDCAYRLMWHFAHQFKSRFATPQVVFDARALQQWLYEKLNLEQKTWYFMKNLYSIVPYHLRKKDRLLPAIYQLEQWGTVETGDDANGARMVILKLPA